MISIPQIIQIYFSGITVLLVLALFSLLLCRHVGEQQRKVLPIFAFVTLGFLTAVWFTRGNTSLWPAFILVIVGLWHGEKHINSSVLGKTLVEVAYLFFLFTGFFILMFILSSNRDGDLIISNYDTPFYVRLVEHLMLTGNESFYLERLYPEENGVLLYHYLEHWLAAFIKIITPNIPTIYSFDLVLNPLLFSLATLGFFHLVGAVTKRTDGFVYMLAPIIVFGIATPEIVDALPSGIPCNLNRSWSPFEQPKAAVAYIFLSPLLLAVHIRHLKQLWIMSMLLGVCFIPTIPTVTLSAMLITVLWVLLLEVNWQKALISAATSVLIASLGLGIWLVFNYKAKSFGGQITADEILAFYHHYAVGIIGVSVISSVVIFLPALILLTAIRRLNLEIVVFVLSLYGFGLICYASLGFEFESFQLFQTISLPALTSLLLLLAAVILIKSNHILLRAVVFVFLVLVANTRIVNYGFIIAKGQEIIDLKSFVTQEDVQTAFIRNPKEYEGAVQGKQPYLHFPIEQLHSTSSSYHSFSLNELSWQVVSPLYQEEYRFKEFSSFCRFVNHEGVQDSSLESQQRTFLVKNNIHYLEASAMSDISALNLTIVDSLVFQNGSRLYRLDYDSRQYK
ncbi:MAG: hypothetical protein K9J17_02060 [Flavobacteriales bacterium]|nr:hypothetical protein [Flavobacteriales bacterium]